MAVDIKHGKEDENMIKQQTAGMRKALNESKINNAYVCSEDMQYRSRVKGLCAFDLPHIHHLHLSFSMIMNDVPANISNT